MFPVALQFSLYIRLAFNESDTVACWQREKVKEIISDLHLKSFVQHISNLLFEMMASIHQGH